jgi:SH3-like domain-containing protein
MAATRANRRRWGGVVLASLALLGGWLAGAAALAQDLPVPRFVAMRTSEANVRTGPNLQYPIEWVYVRPGLPVEVQRDHGNWRLIRDWQGVGGWVHVSQLTGRRSVLVDAAGLQPLLADPDPEAGLVARVEPEAIGQLLECPDPQTPAGAYCLVRIQGYEGWMARAALWGVYPDETVD